MKSFNRKLIIIFFIVCNLILTSNALSNEFLLETKEIKFTPELVELAQKLEHNPVKIYNWVYENIEYEHYQLLV